VKDPARIKTLIDEGLRLYCVLTFDLYLMHHPGVQQIIATEFDDPNASVDLGRKDGTPYSLPLHAMLVGARNNATQNISRMRLLGLIIINVHDELLREQLNTARPVHQYLRHLRNALGHGNRWYFKAGEPRYPAQFRTHQLDASMDGEGPVLFDSLGPGDVADLFDDVKASI
jgi:hypothetical protein